MEQEILYLRFNYSFFKMVLKRSQYLYFLFNPLQESSKSSKKPKGILDLQKSKLVTSFDNGNQQQVELSTRFGIQFGNKLLVLETKDEEVFIFSPLFFNSAKRKRKNG